MGSVCSRTVTVKQRGLPINSNNERKRSSIARLKVSPEYCSASRLEDQPDALTNSNDMETYETGTEGGITARDESDSGMCSTIDVVEQPGEQNDDLEADAEDSVLDFNDEIADQNLGSLESVSDPDECAEDAVDDDVVSKHEGNLAATGQDQTDLNETEIGDVTSDSTHISHVSRTHSANATCQLSQMTPVVLVLPASENNTEALDQNSTAISASRRNVMASSRRGSSAGGRISSSPSSTATLASESSSSPSRLRASSSGRLRQKSASAVVAPLVHDRDVSILPEQPVDASSSSANDAELTKTTRPSAVAASKSKVQSTTSSVRQPTSTTTTTTTTQTADRSLNRRRSTRYFDAFVSTNKTATGGNGQHRKSFDAKNTWKSVRRKVIVQTKTGNDQSRKKSSAPQQSKPTNRNSSANNGPQPVVVGGERQLSAGSRPSSRSTDRSIAESKSDVTDSERSTTAEVGSASTDASRRTSQNTRKNSKSNVVQSEVTDMTALTQPVPNISQSRATQPVPVVRRRVVRYDDDEDTDTRRRPLRHMWNDGDVSRFRVF